jgi:membrane-bound lytic murein transglycosylase MltF
VDFTVPGQTDVRKVVVTGPGSPVEHLSDLAEIEIGVREGSIELQSLQIMNSERLIRGVQAIPVKTLPVTLNDEDLLEMVNAGLLEATVVDEVIGDFWAAVLPHLTMRRQLSFGREWRSRGPFARTVPNS